MSESIPAVSVVHDQQLAAICGGQAAGATPFTHARSTVPLSPMPYAGISREALQAQAIILGAHSA